MKNKKVIVLGRLKSCFFETMAKKIFKSSSGTAGQPFLKNSFVNGSPVQRG